jgi:GT2 family glycosyltransferase/glycosyltransferase involved in cell wall biosynthesis
VNFLFVNYGDFTSNSLNHIGAFANRLTLLGHSCVVAVPENPRTISAIHRPLFSPVTFERALLPEPLFPDRRPADVVHAWTPRENVREFTLAYLRRAPNAVLVIHLEDNEVFLMESFAGESVDKLRLKSDEELATRLTARLSHPVRFKNFLRVAHGATYITDKLREFIPFGKPSHRLLPGIDPALYQPLIPDPALRENLGVRPNEKLIVFTGSTTFANLADVRTLLLAVRQLNETGTACKLVRTGINPAQLERELTAIGGDYVVDLGFVEKTRLGELLSIADALVQPGVADAFNDYRLPSKIPEFLSVGRPVIIPRANLAREMQDGRHALLLDSGTPEEIAEKCRQVFGSPTLAQELSEGALEFARGHFNLDTNTSALLNFYATLRASARPIFVDLATPPSEDVLLADGDTALRMRAKEQSLTAARAELKLLRAEKIRLLAQESYQHAKLQAERQRGEVLRAQLDQANETVVRLTRSVDDASVQAQIHRDKVQRMTASFSWQVTSPLRSLRRLFVDSRKTKVRAVAPSVPKPDESFAYVLDEPRDWNDVAPNGTLRGWVINKQGAAIAGVRVRIAGKVIEATYGLVRADVATEHAGHAHALHSGFTLEYSAPPETSQPFILEALTDDGQWRCFAVPSARVTAEIPTHLRRDYVTWIRRFDTLSLEQAVSLRARIEGLPPEQRPLISILMPVFNTPEPWLVKAIESVRAQFYPHWELCIANDASTAPHVRGLLEKYAARDGRIKVVHRENNGHISAASNSALDLATGEFTALLDHDDELAPHALAEVVFALVAQPALEFIYSDEDKIDELGRRFDPYFKPDWNPDLLLGQNYTCHLSTFRTARLRAIGGFREGFEGSQDWDLTLRAVEGLDAAKIHHVPKVLYHWRAIPGSTALVIDQKENYPFIAAKKALTEYLTRTSVAAELVSVAGFHWRVKRALPVPPPKVSIIIPTHNAEGLLRVTISSLRARSTYPDYELIIVNNRSDDPGTLAFFDELRGTGVRVLDYDAPFNFSAINNFAAKEAQGAVLAFLNNDVEVLTPDWLEEMVSQAIRPEIGAVGAMLYYPDDTVQHAGVVLGLTGPAGRDGVAGHAFKEFKRGDEGQRNRLRLVQNYSAVTAACLVIRHDLFDTVGGFNETELAVAFNDIDFCLRVRAAGYRNLWTPFAEFYHHESASRGEENTPEKVARFQREAAFMRKTWGALLDRDPAYNPNLSLQHEDFSLAFPPR